jgi:glycyl-tRNA synthetase alpha chain
MTLQEMMQGLARFWSEEGCVVHQPYDKEVGAGTMHPETFFRSLGDDPWRVAYCQPSRRPADGRYAANPMRVYEHFQYQVILKPSPMDVQELYLRSLESLGIRRREHDIRFEEDNWESPTLGAAGVGWQVTMDGMEISQFTYFQVVGGVELRTIPVELTYGLERMCMFINDIRNIFDIPWARAEWHPGGFVPYRALRELAEVEQSTYCFEEADVDEHRRAFEVAEAAARRLVERTAAGEPGADEAEDVPAPLLIPAYERVLDASHLFNVLDARGALSVTERADMIQRVRRLSVLCAKAWLRHPARRALLEEAPR